jgi:hypothetical protein
MYVALCISNYSMEELGDQCNVVFAGLLYRINLEIAGEKVEGRGSSPPICTHWPSYAGYLRNKLSKDDIALVS